MWEVTELDDGTVHVVPEDEKPRHEPASTCPCGPRVEVHDSLLILHNSFDGREAVEWAEGILNPASS
jgi:hypothetical protein